MKIAVTRTYHAHAVDILDLDLPENATPEDIKNCGCWWDDIHLQLRGEQCRVVSLTTPCSMSLIESIDFKHPAEIGIYKTDEDEAPIFSNPIADETLYYVVTGRLIGDDEDTVIQGIRASDGCQASQQAQLYLLSFAGNDIDEELRCLDYTGLVDWLYNTDKDIYRTDYSVFINSVASSPSPIVAD